MTTSECNNRLFNGGMCNARICETCFSCHLWERHGIPDQDPDEAAFNKDDADLGALAGDEALERGAGTAS